MLRQMTNSAFADSAKLIHASHTLSTHGNDGVVYCVKCAAWCANSTIRKLRHLCTGRILEGSAHAFRLLQLGVMPMKGARIPPGALRKWQATISKRKKLRHRRSKHSQALSHKQSQRISSRGRSSKIVEEPACDRPSGITSRKVPMEMTASISRKDWRSDLGGKQRSCPKSDLVGEDLSPSLHFAETPASFDPGLSATSGQDINKLDATPDTSVMEELQELEASGLLVKWPRKRQKVAGLSPSLWPSHPPGRDISATEAGDTLARAESPCCQARGDSCSVAVDNSRGQSCRPPGIEDEDADIALAVADLKELEGIGVTVKWSD